MRRISGILLTLAMVVSIGLSVASAETLTYTSEQQRLADTPSKYGFKGLFTLFSPDTAQQGKYGMGVYWDLARFCLPGDPRYPQVHEISLVGYYGITDSLEIGLAVPYRMVKLPKASEETRASIDPALKDIDESGIGNVSIGLRYNVLRGGNFELTPYVLAFLPTSQDPEKGLGADNTRIHIGASFGTVLENMKNTRLYGQVAYQIATKYDQARQDFTETDPFNTAVKKPRFDYYGTNPLFEEFGSTLFYGAGFAVPIVEDTAEFFTEFQLYHSFEKEDYIPMFEDGKELDVVQDGGIANAGVKIGFGNGMALTAGGGAKLFAKEPMHQSATWRAFAGLTYNSTSTVAVELVLKDVPQEDQAVALIGPGMVIPPELVGPGGEIFDCRKALAMVNFEFDKSTLTPEGIAVLQQIGKYMRLCDQAVLEVQGHTDWEGTENYNMGLGNRRARAVVYYLVYDEGIDPARIVKSDKLERGIIAGETYGESKPIASNETDAGRAQNRRAQFEKIVPDNRIIGKN